MTPRDGGRGASCHRQVCHADFLTRSAAAPGPGPGSGGQTLNWAAGAGARHAGHLGTQYPAVPRAAVLHLRESKVCGWYFFL